MDGAVVAVGHPFCETPEFASFFFFFFFFCFFANTIHLLPLHSLPLTHSLCATPDSSSSPAGMGRAFRDYLVACEERKDRDDWIAAIERAQSLERWD